MAFVRTLLRKFVRNKRKIQEEHDVWRLYHLLYYFEQSGGKEVKVARPQNVSYHEQYRTVHSAVTKQVYITSGRIVRLFLKALPQ